MANEATLIVELESPINFTIANLGGISKGALLKLVDPMTASGAGMANANIAGIAATEKISNDGTTKLGIYRRGIFKMSLSGAANVGDSLKADASLNYVRVAGLATDSSGARIIGHALETGANNETILVAVNIGAGGQS